MELVVDRKAYDDIVEIAVWFTRRSGPRLTTRFLEAVERALIDLAAMPGLGHPQWFRRAELRHLRVWPIRGFNQYLLVYAIETRIVVLRVLHGARDLDRLLGPDEVREPTLRYCASSTPDAARTAGAHKPREGAASLASAGAGPAEGRRLGPARSRGPSGSAAARAPGPRRTRLAARLRP